MKPNKREPEVDPIISDAAARFTMVLFLALFTIGAALLIWRGISSVPEGDHWIDRVMSAVKTFSTFAAMLLIQYMVFAARVYAERTEEQLRLRFQHGLEECSKQAAQRFSEEDTDVRKAWTEWTELAEAARVEGRPEPEPPTRPGNPGVDATSSLRGLNSMTTQNHQPTPFGGEPEHPLTPATRSADSGPEGTDQRPSKPEAFRRKT